MQLGILNTRKYVYIQYNSGGGAGTEYAKAGLEHIFIIITMLLIQQLVRLVAQCYYGTTASYNNAVVNVKIRCN